MSHLIILDGHAILYRSWYAISDMSVDGFSTNALFGFSGVLLKLANKLVQASDATNLIVVFDPPGEKTRHKIFPGYKANRPPMPEALVDQLAVIQELVAAYRFPLCLVPGIEADDVIGTLIKDVLTQADKNKAKSVRVSIAATDKDFAQLISQQVSLLNVSNDSTLDSAGVVKKFGVQPEQIVDYLSLIGDSADAIPGVPDVGPKTAAKWLNLFGSLQAIIKNIDQIPSKKAIVIGQMKDQLALNQKLITIMQDVSYQDNFISNADDSKQPDLTAAWTGPNFEAVDALYQKYQLTTHRTRLKELQQKIEKKQNSNALPLFTSTAPPADPPPTEALPEGYHLLTDIPSVKTMVAHACRTSMVAIDCETTSLNVREAELVGISFSFEPGTGYYLPLGHVDPQATTRTLLPGQLPLPVACALLRPFFASPAVAICGHNLKYDASVLEVQSIPLANLNDDTLIMAHLCGARNVSLDSLVAELFNHRMTSFTELTARHAAPKDFAKVPILAAARYAIEDADYALRLQQHYAKKIETHPSHQLYRTIELPLTKVLSAMELNGVLVDASHLNKLSKEFTQECEAVEDSIADIAGKRINLSSPKQVGELLYQTLGCPILGKTPGGAPSTSESVLETLSLPPYNVEVAKLILDRRMFNKLVTTYTDPLPRLISPTTGRIHTSYHQAATLTGRLSSTQPNLQNIPIGTEAGARVREAFIVPDGYTMISADYSQVELRVMAHLSGDQALIEAFNNNKDIHQSTASEVFDTPLTDVTEEQRRAAKAINFGLIYGMGAFGLASRLQITREEAKDYIDRYFNRYPKVRTFMEQTVETAKQTQTVQTLSGRVINLPSINSKNFQERRHSERVAINAPVQGTAAEIIKSAMIKTMQLPLIQTQDMFLLMQVHDELIFEVKDTHTETALDAIQQTMAEATTLSVPLSVSIKAASNWNKAH